MAKNASNYEILNKNFFASAKFRKLKLSYLFHFYCLKKERITGDIGGVIRFSHRLNLLINRKREVLREIAPY